MERNRTRATSRQSAPKDIKLLPAVLGPTLPGEHRHRVREELVLRIRGEFEEMPGLSLTSVQAIKLFGISPEVCAGILSHLIEEGVLRLKSDGSYTRRIDVA
jgi:hypothetical protein